MGISNSKEFVELQATENMTTREQIIETVNKLFIYTDYREWEKLQNEVFTENVHLDMSSLGAEPMDTTAREICEMWNTGFKDIDAVNHLGGNYLVELIADDKAKVFAYATATHFKQSATKGQTREFVGSYDLELELTDSGWRIYSFTYNLKYMSGNATLE